MSRITALYPLLSWGYTATAVMEGTCKWQIFVIFVKYKQKGSKYKTWNYSGYGLQSTNLSNDCIIHLTINSHSTMWQHKRRNSKMFSYQRYTVMQVKGIEAVDLYNKSWLLHCTLSMSYAANYYTKIRLNESNSLHINACCSDVNKVKGQKKKNTKTKKMTTMAKKKKNKKQEVPWHHRCITHLYLPGYLTEITSEVLYVTEYW